MDLRSARAPAYYFWTGIALILIFAMLEPAGTREAGFLKGLFVWTLQIGLLLPILIGAHMGLQATAIFDRLNPWLKLTLSGLAGSVLFVPPGLGIDYLFALDDWSALAGPGDAAAVVLEEFGAIVLPVTITWVAINAPRILGLDFGRKNPEAPLAVKTSGRDAETVDRPEFVSMIPAEIGDDVVYLKSELHYVRVVTPIGERLVLSNMKDALADLERVAEGIQTHRSYWVSGAHIRSIVTEGGRKYVVTSLGPKIPVSRRKSAETVEFVHGRRRMQALREKGSAQ